MSKAKELLAALEKWDNDLAVETESRLKQWLEDNNIDDKMLKKLADSEGSYLQQRLESIAQSKFDND